MKISKRQLRSIIHEVSGEEEDDRRWDEEQIIPWDAFRDTARDKIEVILNEFYDDLVEDSGLTAEEAQMQVQDLIDTLSLHARQGFIGMPT